MTSTLFIPDPQSAPASAPGRISFIVPAVPIAQPRQRHRVVTANGRTFASNYLPAKHPVNDFKASVRMAAQAVYQGPPLEGPVFIRAVMLFPRPGRMIWKSRPMPRARHTSKPDTENVLKAILDCLTGILFRDDAQVCSIKAAKWYAAGDEAPGVMIEVEQMTLTESPT